MLFRVSILLAMLMAIIAYVEADTDVSAGLRKGNRKLKSGKSYYGDDDDDDDDDDYSSKGSKSGKSGKYYGYYTKGYYGTKSGEKSQKSGYYSNKSAKSEKGYYGRN